MKVRVSLKLSTTSNPQILIDGHQYIQSMTNNSHFAAAEIIAQLIATEASLVALRNVINAPISASKTDDIKIAREVVDRNLTKLANKVEEVANDVNTPDANRVEVVHSAFMDIRGTASPQKHKFTVLNGEVSGTVHLTAQGGANAHEWQYTTDVFEFTNRIAAETTTLAHTDIERLKNVTAYAFFHKAIVRGEKTDWEGPIILTVL